jgi:hypothetical protein
MSSRNLPNPNQRVRKLLRGVTRIPVVISKKPSNKITAKLMIKMPRKSKPYGRYLLYLLNPPFKPELLPEIKLG